MYLMYVDESGDTGIKNSPTPFYILSGLILHELIWRETLEAIIDFRSHLRKRYGLKLREEIHSTAFIHSPDQLSRIHKSIRLQILKDVISFQTTLPGINIISIVVDKKNKELDQDLFQLAWTALIQRFHNTIYHHNFPGPQNTRDHGLIITDQTDEPKLKALTRQMRRYNPVPSHFPDSSFRNIPIHSIIEDPVHRNSHHSYFIQICDVNAFFLYQKLKPCSYIKKKGGVQHFGSLDPVLCKFASTKDPLGIVFI